MAKKPPKEEVQKVVDLMMATPVNKRFPLAPIMPGMTPDDAEAFVTSKEIVDDKLSVCDLLVYWRSVYITKLTYRKTNEGHSFEVTP